MFDRFIALIGKENFDKIRQKRIVVIGLGGVGGYVVESLVRSGIEKLTIVDGDTIDETNINRQIIALHSTIGCKKTEIFENRIKDINPNVSLEKVSNFLSTQDVYSFGFENFDYIVDCIDDVAVKVELARFAVDHGKKIIVSTGTAQKLHPEDIRITTLDKTSYDPLAKVLRRELRDISKKIKVVTSTENHKKSDSRTLGSSAFVPSTAGIMMASYIINDILTNEDTCCKIRDNTRMVK